MSTVRIAVFTISVIFLTSGNVIPDGSETRQVGLPANYVNFLSGNIPCECKTGVCKCCLKVIGMNGCAELVYIPQEFAFEMRMKFNERIWMKRKISGKNPPPICFTPPRYGVGQACITFHEIYFFGRNMHVCLNFEASLAEVELINRDFDCIQLGDKGVKVVKPGEGYPVAPADLDVPDEEDIEDYDENV